MESKQFKKIYHAAIYVRLSKEDGDVASASKAESNSISNQKELIRNFLKDKEDIVVVSERVDDGYSGSSFERPGFQQMLEDIRRGSVDCVIVKDLSRFGREYIDTGRYIERLFPALGVRFIAVNDHYDSLRGDGQGERVPAVRGCRLRGLRGPDGAEGVFGEWEEVLLLYLLRA